MGGLDLMSVASLGAVICLMSIVVPGLIYPQAEDLKDARNALCGGELDWAYTLSKVACVRAHARRGVAVCMFMHTQVGTPIWATTKASSSADDFQEWDMHGKGDLTTAGRLIDSVLDTRPGLYGECDCLKKVVRPRCCDALSIRTVIATH